MLRGCLGTGGTWRSPTERIKVFGLASSVENMLEWTMVDIILLSMLRLELFALHCCLRVLGGARCFDIVQASRKCCSFLSIAAICESGGRDLELLRFDWWRASTIWRRSLRLLKFKYGKVEGCQRKFEGPTQGQPSEHRFFGVIKFWTVHATANSCRAG